ncbi:hypothetical protein Q9314_15265 [Shinella sumterensis]|nr:hypothetical protein Q9314_15265 [Shinella sumterensis]
MKPADTVMRRALDRFKNLSEEEKQRLAAYRAACVRDLAVEALKDHGVVLIGHPSLIEYAVSQECVLTAKVHEAAFEGKAARKRGRPAVDPVVLNIYTAALAIFEQEGVSVAAAAKQAAKFLGEPATKDRVEKGRKRWLETASVFLTLTNGSETTREFLTRLVASNVNELKRIAAELDADKAAEADRRRSARFTNFIGATEPRKVASPK